jgi:Xaa-Pro aminopeptidase
MYLPNKERERRYERVREAMAKEDVGVLLVVGNNHATGNPSFATGSFRYLTDFFIISLYGMLVFFREGNPVMLVPMELQEIYAKKYSWIDDVRTSFDYAEAVAQLLENKGLTHGRVGIAGMDSIPVTAYHSLKERLPKAEFFDATSILVNVRFIKGEEERKMLTEAAKLNDGAYKEVLGHIRPGIKEYEIGGIIDGYQRRNGADRTFNLISSGPFPISKEGVPFEGHVWAPGLREIKKGDCILLEMTTVYGGYWNQLVRIVSVGVENTELLRFQQTAFMTIHSGLETMKTGLKTSEFFSTMAKIAASCGFKLITPMGHFIGLDLVEGRVDSESKVIFAPGITFILHPNIADKQGIHIFCGQTYFMTEKGPIALNETDETLPII